RANCSLRLGLGEMPARNRSTIGLTPEIRELSGASFKESRTAGLDVPSKQFLLTSTLFCALERLFGLICWLLVLGNRKQFSQRPRKVTLTSCSWPMTVARRFKMFALKLRYPTRIFVKSLAVLAARAECDFEKSIQ